MRCDPATAWLAMLGGRTRFTNSTRRAHILRHRSGRHSPPHSAGTLELRTGCDSGSTPAKRGACPAPSRRRPISVPCRRAVRKRGAAPRWRAGPAWARVVLVEDMGKRYHAQPKPRAGPARRWAGPRAGPATPGGRARCRAQRFEAAQRLALLGRASCDEPRAVAEAAEGERQGPQELTGEAFDELDCEPGEVPSRERRIRPPPSQLRSAQARRGCVRGSRLDQSRYPVLHRCPERGQVADVARLLDAAPDRDAAGG